MMTATASVTNAVSTRALESSSRLVPGQQPKTSIDKAGYVCCQLLLPEASRERTKPVLARGRLKRPRLIFSRDQNGRLFSRAVALRSLSKSA